jgi:RNA recognition motif-containing protein
MNVVREVNQINLEELRRGIDGSSSASWHATYANSAWVYIGGLEGVLTEGDIVCVFSQWGEIEDIALVRDEATGRSKGFCFLKYEDARSAILAVDNMNGVSLLGKVLRVDHKLEYKRPEKRKREAQGNEERNETAESSQLIGQEGLDVFGQIEREKERAKVSEEMLNESTMSSISKEKDVSVAEEWIPRASGGEASRGGGASAGGASSSLSSTTTTTRGRLDIVNTKNHGGRSSTLPLGGGVSDWRGRYAANASRGGGAKR